MQVAESVIDALAVARISRLVTADSITRPWRAAIIRRAYARRDGPEKERLSDVFVEHMIQDDHEPPRLAEFVTCQWCVSAWTAVGVVAARRYAPALWDPVARALAASMVTGLLTVNAE